MGTGSSAIEKIKTIGNDYFSKGEYSKAIIAYTKALRYDPYNHLLLGNRCAAYLKLNKLKNALEDAQECIKQCKSWNKGYYRLALVFKSLDLNSEALFNLRISLALQADPTVSSSLNELENTVNQLERGKAVLLELGNHSLRPTPIPYLIGVQITEVACGIAHVLALSFASELYVWGDNTQNQCGIAGSTNNPRILPKLIDKGVRAVCCGGGHSMAFCNNGEVYAWGINAYGQCALPGNNIPEPTLLKLNTKIKAGSAGLGHTVILDDKGRALATGWNNCGQLGIGNTINSRDFVVIGDLANINHISCGAAHTLFVTINGELFSTGTNSCGQLGLGHLQDVFSPQKIPTANSISFARCGEEFSILVSADSNVYAFGLGNVGQLGNGENSVNPNMSIITNMPKMLGTEYAACTKSQVLAVTRNGQTYSWGLIGDYSGNPPSIKSPMLLSSLKSREVKEIQCLRETFLISLKYTHPEKCFISHIPLEAIEAGKKYSLYLQLVNNDLEFTVSPGDRISAKAFSHDTGNLSKGEIIVYFDNRRYIIELRLIEAGNHDIYVWCNGLQVTNSPAIYTVSPTSLCSCKCYLPIINKRIQENKLIVHAGGEFMLDFLGFDKYDNQSSIGGELYIEDVFIEGSEGLEKKLIDLGDGKYQLFLKGKRAGDVLLKIKVKGLYVEAILQDLVIEDGEPKIVEIGKSEEISVQILPGAAYGPSCIVNKLKDTYFAGENLQFSVDAIDSYGNTTWNFSEFDIKILINNRNVEYSKITSVDYCGNIISFPSFIAGDYQIQVSYQNEQIINKKITIFPGPVSILKSIVKGNGIESFQISKKKNGQRSIEIEFYDDYDNPANPENLDFSVKDFNKNPILTSISQSSFNIYTCSYNITTHGFYTIDLFLPQGRLNLFPLQINAWKDPKTIKKELELIMKAKLEEQERLKKIEEERLKKIEEEARLLRELEEEKRKKELEDKRRREEELLKEKQKKLDEIELEKRRRIMQKIKNEEVTRKRATEALRKFEEQKAKEEREAKERKKWKRIGGGFNVPFQVDD
ncbi:unnamed protein product [Blepharisma stoltei]|uniref:RCC1-like domain-containing protein n=1 Tax=Blepharisma stoltei TaxID=1481888 RepID=A0AAU9JXU0_9CILI|nr:unnamed protein product [Blepharisma stoltei]